MEDKLLKILICIECLSDVLWFTERKFVCRNCNKEYKIKNGIPIMLKGSNNSLPNFGNKTYPIAEFSFDMLDIGCGIEPCGDVNVDIENVYSKYGVRPKNFIVASATALPFKNQSFKVAYARWIIEHLKDEEVLKVITEIRRVAKRAIFVVPNAYFIPGCWKYSCTTIGSVYREIMRRSPHIQIFNEKMLRELLKTTFKKIKIYGEGTWIEIPVLEKLFLY